MAYMSQQKKKELAPAIKAVLKKYGVKGTLAVRHHSTLVLNISEGPLDICGNYWSIAKDQLFYGRPYQGNHEVCDIDHIQVNQYHYDKHFSGKVLKFLEEIVPLMFIGHEDKSDIQSDFFCVSWYVDINVGQWDKPYRYLPKSNL